MLNYELELMKEKIDSLCDENKLQFNFETLRFPIIAKIKPNFETQNQITIDVGDKTTNYINGEIQFIFGDELTMTVLNDFRIEDSILNRIKNMTKKLHYLFLQNYFKEKVKVDG